MTRQRIALLYLATLLVLLLASWLVLRQTDVTRSIIERSLAGHVVRECFTLDGAGFDFAVGEARLRGLQLDTPADRPGRLALHGDRVAIGIGTHPMRAPGALRYVHASGLHLEIDLVDGRMPDLSGLLIDSDDDSPPPHPVIELTEVTLLLRLADDREALQLAVPELRLVPITDRAEAYGLWMSADLAGLPPLEIVGSVDTASGAFEVSALSNGDGGTLDLDRIAAAAPDVARLLADFAVGGRLAALRAEVRGDGDGQLQVDAEATLAELTLGGPRVPLPVVDADATVQFAWRSGTAADLRFQLSHRSADGDLDALGLVRLSAGATPVVDVDVTATNLLIRPAIGSALQDLRPGRMVWDAFEPRGGRCDAKCHFTSRNAEPGSSPVLDLEIDIREGRGRYVGFIDGERGTRSWGFPIPLEDVRGRVLVRNGMVTVEDASARLGEDRVTVNGTVDVRGQDHLPPGLDLRITSPRVPFDATIRAALGDLYAPAVRSWDEYAPQGESAVDVHVVTGPGTAEPGIWITLRPLLASASYAGFPCRVDDLEGRIDIAPEGVSIDLRGLRGESAVQVRGRFASDRVDVATGPHSELAIGAQDFVTDDVLLASLRDLSPALDEAVELFGARCGGNAEVALWRASADAPFAWEVRVDVADGRVELETMAIPVIDLSGQLFVRGDGAATSVEIDAMRGRVAQTAPTPPAELFVHGRIREDAAGRQTRFAALVDGLSLDRRVAEAVDRYGVFGLDDWQVVQPAGLIDLEWRSERSRDAGAAAASIDQEIDIHLRGVSSQAAFLPGPAEQVTGSVLVKDGVADLRDLRGTMLGAEFRCPTGRIDHLDGASRLEVLVQSSSFPIDDSLANLLSGPLRASYLERQLRGTARIDDVQVTAIVADDGQFRSELRGALEASGFSMQVGGHIEGLSGRVVIDQGRFDPDGGAVAGKLEAVQLSLLGQRISHGDASFAVDADSVLISDLQARLHRGRLRGMSTGQDIYYAFGADPELRCDLLWEGASLQELLPDSGLRGTLRLRAKVDGLRDGDLGSAKAQGRIEITGGDLGEDPVFRSIYSWLEKPRRPVFRDLSADLQLVDRALRITDLEVSSEQARIQGEGEIGLDGHVDLDLQLPDLFGRDNDWMLLPWVVRELSNQLVGARLHGYVNDLRVDLFGLGSAPERQAPLGPLPPLPGDGAASKVRSDRTGDR